MADDESSSKQMVMNYLSLKQLLINYHNATYHQTENATACQIVGELQLGTFCWLGCLGEMAALLHIESHTPMSDCSKLSLAGWAGWLAGWLAG